MGPSINRYHVVPRDSIDSDRESHEYLIPSPQSGILDATKAGKTCNAYINISVVLRIVSIVLGLVSFIVLIIHGHEPFIASLVFLMLSITLNILLLLHRRVSPILRFSIFYRERDILDFGKGSFTRPYLSSYLDLFVSIGLMVSLIVGLVCFDRWYWSWESAVAGSVFGYLVVGLQAIIAIPVLDRVGFTIKASIRGTQQRVSLEPAARRPDMKDTLMTGAADTSEASAIPVPEAPIGVSQETA